MELLLTPQVAHSWRMLVSIDFNASISKRKSSSKYVIASFCDRRFTPIEFTIVSQSAFSGVAIKKLQSFVMICLMPTA